MGLEEDETFSNYASVNVLFIETHLLSASKVQIVFSIFIANKLQIVEMLLISRKYIYIYLNKLVELICYNSVDQKILRH